jgi:hypothetical protein
MYKLKIQSYYQAKHHKIDFKQKFIKRDIKTSFKNILEEKFFQI